MDAIEENFHLSQIDTAVREPEMHDRKLDGVSKPMPLENPEYNQKILQLTEELLVALRETKEAHRETKEAYKKIAELKDKIAELQAQEPKQIRKGFKKQDKELERLRKDKG